MEVRKVFWLGKHASLQELGVPLGKVHKAGLAVLLSHGWQQVPNTTTDIPIWSFTTRKGANYPADAPGLPHVRHLPQRHTACLDDKRQLQQVLQAAGQGHLSPRSWVSIEAYLSWLQAHQQELVLWQQQGHLLLQQLGQQPHQEPQQQEQHKEPQQQSTPASVFVKHRLGVKGQAVYVAHTEQDLQQLQQRLKGSAADFVVQEEVAPPMLLQGRKFVLRMHVLVALPRSTAAAAAAASSPHSTPQRRTPRQAVPQLAVYAHEDVIVVQHARVYDQNSSDAAVHISSKGQGHPRPVLLLRDLPQLHASVWPQLRKLAAATIAAALHALVPPQVHPQAVLYHLFGFDCMVDASGRPVLLEVNSYPAIASGTMAAVPVDVFTRLVSDVVTLLVLPVADGVPPQPGGFVLLM